MRISATNSAGTSQAVVTVTITAPPAAVPATAAPVLNSSAVALGGVGVFFIYDLTATQSPTSFSASNLPPGVTCNAATGALHGTPTNAGTFLVPVTAANAYGASTGTLTVTVFANSAAQAAAEGEVEPILVSPASTVGTVGQGLTYNLAAEFIGDSYTNTGSWSFNAAGLPPGLSVTQVQNNQTFEGTGVISGTPMQAGTYRAAITVVNTSGDNNPYPFSNTYQSVSASTAVVTFTINATEHRRRAGHHQQRGLRVHRG